MFARVAVYEIPPEALDRLVHSVAQNCRQLTVADTATA